MRKLDRIPFGMFSILLSIGLVGQAMAADQCSQLKYVDKDGNISLPQDFRRDYTHLGSWYVPEGDASGFHDVYLDPVSVEYYHATNTFPDGAILIKELRSATQANYTTGNNVAYATDTVKQTFVMIKDNCGRDYENPVWSEGWGWGLFSLEQGFKNQAKSFQQDCKACHLPAKDTDWVYIEAYPTLRSFNEE